MKYYKLIFGDYILGIACGKSSAIEITVEEYNTIKSVIENKPMPTGQYDYRLKKDLTWERYEVDPPTPEDEVSDSEALEILLGGVK